MDFALFVDTVSKSFLTKEKEYFTVLKDISFAIPRGKIVSILGASGCGKTTLLQILAGLTKPDSGTIQSSIQRPGPKIGFLQQSEQLLPWRTVQDNVSLGLELIGENKEKARTAAQEMLALVEMRKFENNYPVQLSGGMKQRVLLARTFVTLPSLLLLDEPLGQLDVVGRKDLAAHLRDYVSKNNAAALLVTHSIEEAVFISDIILTLSRRPSQIVDRFALEDPDKQQGYIHLPRTTCFDTVLQSLLRALGSEQSSEDFL